MLTAVKNYFISSVSELKKVTWPTKQQTINYSVIVIIMSIGVAAFFGLLDYGFSKALNQLIK